jgi:hypothetical protein
MRTSSALPISLLLAGHLLGAQATTTRDERWREDVRFLARELPARHKNAFAYVDQATFARAAAALDSAIPRLTDAQIQLRISGLAGLLRDGHTNAPLPTYALRLPLAVLWLDSGAFIVDADDDHRALIGSRITRAEGHAIRDVADSIRRYFSYENERWFQYRAGGLLLRPMGLRDAGIGTDTTSTTLEVTRDGVSSTVTIAAVPGQGFSLPVRGDLPLYRQRAGEKYWWTWLPEERIIFVKYTKCIDPADFKQLSDSVARAIDDRHPLRVVVDLRDNSGGNSEVVQPLIAALRSRDAINRPDALYVIMGRVTFSSGLLAAYDFRRRTHATLIGEPTGERPNSYGEVKNFRLPNSGLTINYSTKYFRLVGGEPEAFFPDVLVPPTAEAYIAGRDPVMEWIASHPPAGQR